MREYIAIDTETTGLDPRNDRLCEIAAVKFNESGDEIARFSSLINPQCIISDHLISIHGITNEMVVDAPSFEHVFSRFANFIYDPTIINMMPVDRLIMAHNAQFDTDFINWEISRFTDKISYLADVVDTLALARRKYRFFPNHKLGTLAQKLELPTQTQHRAMGDCLTLKDIFIKSEWHREPESNFRKYQIKSR